MDLNKNIFSSCKNSIIWVIILSRNALDKLIKRSFANLHADVTVAKLSRVTRSWGNMEFVPAVHKFYYIIDGEGYIKIDGREYEPRPKQLFLLPAGTVQSLATVSNETFLKYWCHFSAFIGETDLFKMIEVPHYIDVPDQETGFVERLCHELTVQVNRNEIFSPLKTNSLLFDLLHFYVERAGIGNLFTQSPLSYENLKTITQYMDANLTSELTVPELSKLVHLSPNYFARLFKDMVGLTPNQYMNQLRLDKAQELLRETPMTVTDIAASVGFELHYFSRQYKMYTGFSPRDYRNFHSRHK